MKDITLSTVATFNHSNTIEKLELYITLIGIKNKNFKIEEVKPIIEVSSTTGMLCDALIVRIYSNGREFEHGIKWQTLHKDITNLNFKNDFRVFILNEKDKIDESTINKFKEQLEWRGLIKDRPCMVSLNPIVRPREGANGGVVSISKAIEI